MSGLSLITTGAALPSKCVTNDDLSQMVDTNDEWIRSRTGIRKRYFIGDNETITDLSIQAARQAYERSGLGPEDIGAVICCTMSSDFGIPATACLIQEALGLSEDCAVMDVNVACTGFIYGMAVLNGILATMGGRYGILVGADQFSKVLDMTDRSTCVIFGDGAGAAVFEYSDDADYDAVLGAHGSKMLTTPGYGVEGFLEMDGKGIFRFAVESIPKCLNNLLSKAGVTLDDVDYVVCHQANERIIDHCIKSLKAPEGLFYKNIDHTGNTGAASIPVALNEMYEMDMLTPGQTLVCVGFGGGLSWGGIILKYKGGAK